MALKIIKAVQKQPSVKNLIHREVAGYEKARSHAKIHASDLMRADEFCPREWILLDVTQRARKDAFIGTSQRLTFDHGRDLEWRIRNVYLRKYMVGHWKCGVCGNDHPTFGKAPKIKCKCGFDRWEYEEVRFHCEETGVSGGLDSLMDLGLPKLRILEIKTMDKDEFKGLVAPLAEHRFRTSLYMQLAKASPSDVSNRVDTSFAHILYTSKSFGFKDETLKAEGIVDSPFSPFKEFVIPRDDSLSETVLAKAKVVFQIRKQVESGLPARIPGGVCKTALDRRAANCACVTACFGSKYPATVTWREGGKPRHPEKEVIE